MHEALRRTIGQTRRRLRLQRAFEALTTFGLGWALAATILVYLYKAGVVGWRRFWIAQAIAGGALLLVGLVAALRRMPALRVAKRIDDAHGLHDRIGTALQFAASPERTDFMRAQIEDAARVAPSVQARRAAPLRRPRDLPALGGLLLCLLIVILLRFPGPAPAAVPVRPVARLAVDPEELEPQRQMLKELQRQAEEQNQPEISKLANELNKLFDQIQKQELSKKELFAKIAELEKKYLDGLDGNFDELMKKLKKMSDELQKEKLTQDLAKSIKDADLKKAKEDLEKLAKEIEKLKEKEKKSLAKALDKSAKEKLDQRDLQKKKEELEKQIRRLQKQLKQQPKDEQAKRRLEKKERQLERLNRDQQQAAAQQRQLERLNRDLQKAAESLRQKLSPEAMKALQQAAKQMGRFADQLNKLQMSGKAQGQLADLKELLRRLGQGGKGQKGKLADFMMRAGGGKPGGKNGKDGKDGKGQGKDGKMLTLGGSGKDGTLVMPVPVPGQGQQGQGQDNPNGQPGNGIGTSHDPNLQGKATNLKSQRRDSMLRGKESKGPTRSEVILGASDKGFSASSYRRVYHDYTQIMEEVLKQEDVPLGYQYFVKRYFQLIKPR